MIAAAVPLVIIHSRKQRGRRNGGGRVGRVFSLLRSHCGVLRVFGCAAGFVGAVAGFPRRGNGGDGLRGVSDAEHPGRGRGLGEGGCVGEGVGGGGEERGSDRCGRGRPLRSEGGGTGGGVGEEALGSQRHLPGTQRNETF